MRTKETHYYVAPGATEAAARSSAEGVVQDLEYVSTFPILLNIAGEPTYFIPLKDAANLVKMYAMVNVARYDIVATGASVSSCEQAYIKMMNEKGLGEQIVLPQTELTGVISEIRTAVIDGNTHYFLRMQGDAIFYAISVAQNRELVTLNVGDTVKLEHAIFTEGTTPSVLDAYSVTVLRRA